MGTGLGLGGQFVLAVVLAAISSDEFALGVTACGLALVVVGLDYRRSMRAARANPISESERALLFEQATTGRFAGSTAKMEPFRMRSDWRYARRRARQMLAVGIPMALTGVSLLLGG